MIKAIHIWLKNTLAPGWDLPKPEINIVIDYRYQTWRIDMESFRKSKVVKAQIEAIRKQR